MKPVIVDNEFNKTYPFQSQVRCGYLGSVYNHLIEKTKEGVLDCDGWSYRYRVVTDSDNIAKFADYYIIGFKNECDKILFDLTF